jgi:hypothetical protein
MQTNTTTMKLSTLAEVPSLGIYSIAQILAIRLRAYPKTTTHKPEAQARDGFRIGFKRGSELSHFVMPILAAISVNVETVRPLPQCILAAMGRSPTRVLACWHQPCTGQAVRFAGRQEKMQ